MTNAITIREAVTEQETNFFWEQLYAYYRRDIQFQPGSEEEAYFLDESQYRAQIDCAHNRQHNRCYYLLLSREHQDIGFALAAYYDTEDRKCFLMEFCVLPEFRGNGTGFQCAQAFLDWTKTIGASYTELNCDTQQRRRFWSRSGFQSNGVDEWGEQLMILPPETEVPIHVEILADGEDCQLQKLENGYRTEIGGEVLTKTMQERLAQAVRDGKITVFLAKRGYRAVGMCSVVTAFSVSSDMGILDTLYVEPVFHGKGIARMLVKTAQRWCRENQVGSLRVTCALQDAPEYQALGFEDAVGYAYCVK